MIDLFLVEVRHAIERFAMLRADDSVLVAVSGGPDSMALLAALFALGAGRWRLGVAHVNHRLRGLDSERDEAFVARVAAAFEVPFHRADAPVARAGNVEENARERRYAALLGIAKAGGYRRIATGHTLDDQAETVLHRLLRGAGGAGLCAIAPVRHDGVVRPLLGCGRAEVVAFLRRHRLSWHEDRSNRSVRFTRNRIRNELLPLLERDFNPRVRAALARTAELSRADEDFLGRLAARAFRTARRQGGLDRARLLRLPEALQRRVLRLWLAERRGGLDELTADHVERARSLACAGRGAASLPGGRVRCSAGTLRWECGAAPAVRPLAAVLLPIGGRLEVGGWRLAAELWPGRGSRPRPGRWRAVFDARALGAAALGVRGPKPGDRLRPLGLGGSKKLQDVFVDAHVPREERAGWPILHHGAEILWVPGIVRAETARIEGGAGAAVVVEARRRRARGADGVAAQLPVCYGRSQAGPAGHGPSRGPDPSSA